MPATVLLQSYRKTASPVFAIVQMMCVERKSGSKCVRYFPAQRVITNFLLEIIKETVMNQSQLGTKWAKLGHFGTATGKSAVNCLFSDRIAWQHVDNTAPEMVDVCSVSR